MKHFTVVIDLAKSVNEQIKNAAILSKSDACVHLLWNNSINCSIRQTNQVLYVTSMKI